MSTWRNGNIKLAVASLKATKARSVLTMLGIVIGVMAVICVVCIGQGVKRQIVSQVDHFGKDVLVVRPGNSPAGTGNLFGGDALPNVNGILTPRDLSAVQMTAGVKYAVPLSVATGSATGDHQVKSPLIIATGVQLPQAINQQVQYGGFFDAGSSADQVVLGPNIARALFDDSTPLGQTITYRGKSFIVSGIFNQFSAAPFSLSASFNNAIFMPYTVAQQLSGDTLAIYQILAKSSSVAAAPAVANSVRQNLDKLHGGASDVNVQMAENSTTNSDATLHLLTQLIISVAVIALVVGGIGIMDVLLVSVAERTHEIGLRKAIGATNQQILKQFVAEAFVLSGVGALAGTALSLLVIALLRLFSSFQPVIVWQVLILAPLMAVLVGVVFGTAPAFKAARKDPIDALRGE